ncbi:hypothetical protein, partial [Nocardia fluminea]|uniref:hypothetical protein n=1 Tax=Nocardia fluminea TaxID=134984 RepID=UPI0037AAE32C
MAESDAGRDAIGPAGIQLAPAVCALGGHGRSARRSPADRGIEDIAMIMPCEQYSDLSAARAADDGNNDPHRREKEAPMIKVFLVD